MATLPDDDAWAVTEFAEAELGDLRRTQREEWQALSCALHRTPPPPPAPPSLRQAVHWIARLGGFLDRRGAGEPGATVLWKGFQHLTDLTMRYCIMRPPPAKRKNVGKT